MKVEKSSQDLESEVIYSGLCIHCGSCNAFCPHMDFKKETGQAYVIDECAETVGLCYNSCPRTDLPLSKIEEKLFGQTRIDLALGFYKDIIQVKSKNSDDVLYNLIQAAFKKGIIKHLVVGKLKNKVPPIAIPIIVDSAKDAKSYIPKSGVDNMGPLITGIGQAYKEYKREIGIIANPCHLQGLAKILVSDFNTVAERTTLRVAIACTSGGMAGCRYCTDFSGEFSDITFSPWEFQYKAPEGEGLLIIRSDVGQKVVDAAKEMNLIEITNKNPDLTELKKFLKRKRKNHFVNLIGKDLMDAKYLKLTIDELKDIID